MGAHSNYFQVLNIIAVLNVHPLQCVTALILIEMAVNIYKKS